MEETIDLCVEVFDSLFLMTFSFMRWSCPRWSNISKTCESYALVYFSDGTCKNRLALCGPNYQNVSKIEGSKMSVCSFFRSHKNYEIAVKKRHPKSSYVIDSVSTDNPKKSLNLFRILFESFEKMWIRCITEERSSAKTMIQWKYEL